MTRAFRIKRVYEPAADADGFRVLVDRLWPRGVKKENAKIDLWAKDHYHASTEGYYLEALMVFGDLTGRDPRSLGDGECAAFELGVSQGAVRQLQQVAFDQLTVAKKIKAAPRGASTPVRCTP